MMATPEVTFTDHNGDQWQWTIFYMAEGKAPTLVAVVPGDEDCASFAPEGTEPDQANLSAAVAQFHATYCSTCKTHDCHEHAVPYVSDGPLGHGWECGLCGAFLQAG